MPKYHVELSDGRKFEVEADSPPSAQDVLSALGKQSPEAPQAEPEPPVHPHARIGNAILRMAKNHPGTVGAMTASLAAAPFTSGLSIPAAMLAEGGISAAGALAGHGAKAAITGEGSMSDALSDAAMQGAAGAAGPAVGGALRFAGNWLRGAKPAVENMGGRLVKTPSKAGPVEDEMAAAIADVRKPTLPDRVSLPPPQKQPPVSYPRQAPVKIAKPQAAQQARPAPAQAPAPPPKPTPDLPESWKPFASEVPPSAPKPQLAPRASDSPLGLSDDAPMWSSGQTGATEAGEWRRALGADEAGALLGKSANDVRALSGGGPHRRPMVAELADLDRDYLRQINNPRGEIDKQLLSLLARNIGLGVGGSLLGPVGTVAGVAAANPKQTGRVMYEAGKLPMADMVRAAFLAAMSADDEQ